ncbi:hypothetical protein, partial [Vibrio alginolyticus]
MVPNTWQTKSVRHSDGVPAQTGWGFVEYVPGISVEYVPGISVEYVPGISVEYVPGISVEYVPG